MSKSLRRHRVTDSDEISDHKIKPLKKRDVQRKLVEMEELYLDDEDASPYINDIKFYRAVKDRFND